MLVVGPTMRVTSIVGIFEPYFFFGEPLAPFTMPANAGTILVYNATTML